MMKIYGLDEEIVVDSIPFTYDPNCKIFLTTLVHIETNELLPKIFSKIYTSEPLKRQLQIFLRSRDIEISDDNFHIWKPFEPEMITLSNGTVYEVLPCCPEDITTSILLIFRKESIITHVYVGLCSDLRSTLLNTTLIRWLKRKNQRTSMYVPFSDACQRCVLCEYQRAIIEIEKKANQENTSKLLFQLPLFGSESFIDKLVCTFPRKVILCGLIKDLYMNLPAAKPAEFTDNIDSARFIITSTDSNESMTMELARDFGTLTEKHAIKWSPLPSTVELSVLSDLIQPENVYGISFKQSHTICEQPVKVMSIVSGTSYSTGKFKKERIQSKSITRDKCCLEESERIQKEVILNLKRVLQQTLVQTLKQESPPEERSSEVGGKESKTPIEENQEIDIDVKQENITIEQEEIQENTSNILQENFKHAEENCQGGIKEQLSIQQNMKDSNPPKKISLQKPTTSSQIIVTEFSIKIPKLDLKTINCNKIEKGSVQKNQRMKEMSKKTSSNKAAKCDLSKSQQSKSVGLQQSGKRPCISTSSLVYRKGKRGIGFVDEDSSSSG